jgi:hypothetical protein
MTIRSILPERAARLARHVLATLLLGVLLADAANAAVYTLEILAPRAGLTTTNRYYKAYPGLVYDVNIAAIGGRYPYTYSLTTAPSGMTIDANTGRITWPSPAAQTAAYPVSATVRDAAGTSVSVSWSVLVTTAGFKFVDANNGRTRANGGDGSFANPWRTVADWFVTKYDTSSQNQFLYWRAGTYRTADAPIEDGIRLPSSNSKPVVWLAYPGETPIIDTTGSHISMDNPHNGYFDGLTVQNFTTDFGFRIGSAGTNVQFRRNILRNMPSTAGGSGTNASAIMIANNNTKGSHWAFLDNQFSGIHTVGYGILGYYTDRVLVQGNRFTDFTVGDSKAIGPKTNNSMWFIRDNRINMANGQGIWVDTYATTRDIEISYNLVQMGAGQALWVGQELATYGAITSLRNTYVGGSVLVDNLVGTSGPVSFDRDVIVNNSSTANKITSNNALSTLLSLLTTNLLTGSTSSGVVDAAGNLTGSFTQYVGTRGYQRDGSGDKYPNPPASVTVQ